MKNSLVRLFAVCLIIIPSLSFSYSGSDIYKKVRKNQSLINDIYMHLVTNYVDDIDLDTFTKLSINKIGRASCRERV